MLCFELSMPNVGSWNGKWTGSGKKYFITRRVVAAKEKELNEKNFYYDFGDGWGASIFVEKIDAKEAARRRRISAGFYGYKWMVDEIIEYGRILTLCERKKLRSIS